MHARESQTKDTSKGVVDANGPGHALLTLDGGEDLGRVLEGDGPFSQRVHDCEEVDEEDDGAETSGSAPIFIEQRQTTCEQEDAHEGEGEQSQRTTALGVDEEQRGDGGEDLDGTVAQGGVEGLVGGVADVLEDAGAVEGDDVDAAHLLGNHDGGGTVVGAPDSGDGEAVPETGEVGGAGGHADLLLVHDPGVVVVPGADDGVGAEAAHGLEGVGLPAILHEPTGGFGAEVDANGEDQGRDEGRAELQTPLKVVVGAEDGNVGNETEEDANDDPELPEHDEGTTDAGGSHLGRVDGDRGILGANSNTHDKAGREQTLPRLGACGADRGDSETDGR